MRVQLYRVKCDVGPGWVVKPGQLVFQSNDSDKCNGVVSKVDPDNQHATFMLFEPTPREALPEHIEVLSEELKPYEMEAVYRDIEAGCPGYLHWFVNMDPTDWRKGCPL